MLAVGVESGSSLGFHTHHHCLLRHLPAFFGFSLSVSKSTGSSFCFIDAPVMWVSDCLFLTRLNYGIIFGGVFFVSVLRRFCFAACWNVAMFFIRSRLSLISKK